jgi:hypothetical protein
LVISTTTCQTPLLHCSQIKSWLSNVSRSKEEEYFRKRFDAEMRRRRQRVTIVKPFLDLGEPTPIPVPVSQSYIGRADDVPDNDEGDWAERVAGNDPQSPFIWRSLLRTLNDLGVTTSLLMLSNKQRTLRDVIRMIRLTGHSNNQKRVLHRIFRCKGVFARSSLKSSK